MKILYVMHIPWSWIKQRPQFIADMLSRNHCVKVLDKMPFRDRVKNGTDNRITHLIRIPGERYPIISCLSNFLMAIQISFYLNKYDALWFSDPLMYYHIKNKIGEEKKVIFDCMDDYPLFPTISKNRWMMKHYFKAEKAIFDRADIVFCSSYYLAEQLRIRQEKEKDIFVVNNALDSNFVHLLKEHVTSTYTHMEVGEEKRIVYIGTISHWFDFDLLIQSIARNKEIIYELYGPCDVSIPDVQGIDYKGVVDHDKIADIMKSADLLIMPFKLSPLVLAVNPVKLYEYLSAVVPVVAVSYKETMYFDRYIYLYNDFNDYNKLIDKLLDGDLKTKKNKKEIYEFLKNNTWEKRGNFINKKMEELQ